MRALFPQAGWELVQVNYTNVVAYPAVWLVRKWRRWRSRPGNVNTHRAEDQPLPRWLNTLLREILVRLALVRLPFPFGVSLVLVARRRQ